MTTKHTSASGQTTKVPQPPQPYIKANISTSQTKKTIMPLLDFPAEVFENVVHELVSVAGVNVKRLRVSGMSIDILSHSSPSKSSKSTSRGNTLVSICPLRSMSSSATNQLGAFYPAVPTSIDSSYEATGMS